MSKTRLMTFFFAFLILLSSMLFLNRSMAMANQEEVLAGKASRHIETIVFGAGCFWGVEKKTQALPGVLDVVSGYANGKGIKPIYQDIIKPSNRMNPDNFAEVVQVSFNTSVISLETLLQYYFESHDPTQLNRQGNDIGTQYRSTILITSDQQASTAQKVLNEYQTKLTAAGFGQIVTKIEPLQQFYAAEDYHQDYLKKNPKGYCPDHSTGVTFKEKKKDRIDNKALLKGKYVIVIESEHYCPYCEKFKDHVLKHYQGTIPIVKRFASELDDLMITTPTWATPTILFIEDGREVFGQQGYMSPSEFYEALGEFKLGRSEAYQVAFQKGTDDRFCKQYDIFKNTPDGVFVDKLSGQPLFDTRDRFNSDSGWLSFTKPVDGAVTEHEDKSYGLDRIEIRSATSGIHLGHVFPDGPNGMPRYCINATVLEFKPR